jgi:AraC-like DNA-binding protein
MSQRRGRPKRSETNSFSLEDERSLYRRGVDAYLDASYRSRSRASTSEFAQQFGLAPATLTRTFKRLFGRTPLQYFRSQQLAYAGKLLRRTALPIDDITAITGLGTRTTFFRLFVAQFGMTPDQYRRR